MISWFKLNPPLIEAKITVRFGPAHELYEYDQETGDIKDLSKLNDLNRWLEGYFANYVLQRELDIILKSRPNLVLNHEWVYSGSIKKTMAEAFPIK